MWPPREATASEIRSCAIEETLLIAIVGSQVIDFCNWLMDMRSSIQVSQKQGLKNTFISWLVSMADKSSLRFCWSNTGIIF